MGEDTSQKPPAFDERGFNPLGWMHALADADGLTTRQKTVAAFLSLWANKAGACWPSYRTLAKAVRMHHQSVHRIAKELDAHGVLELGTTDKKGVLFRLRDPSLWKRPPSSETISAPHQTWIEGMTETIHDNPRLSGKGIPRWSQECQSPGATIQKRGFPLKTIIEQIKAPRIPMLGGTILVPYYCPDCEHICLSDQGGFIPLYEEWKELAALVERFYQDTSPEVIRMHNEEIMREHPGVFGEV